MKLIFPTSGILHIYGGHSPLLISSRKRTRPNTHTHTQRTETSSSWKVGQRKPQPKATFSHPTSLINFIYIILRGWLGYWEMSSTAFAHCTRHTAHRHSHTRTHSDFKLHIFYVLIQIHKNKGIPSNTHHRTERYIHSICGLKAYEHTPRDAHANVCGAKLIQFLRDTSTI